MGCNFTAQLRLATRIGIAQRGKLGTGRPGPDLGEQLGRKAILRRHPHLENAVPGRELPIHPSKLAYRRLDRHRRFCDDRALRNSGAARAGGHDHLRVQQALIGRPNGATRHAQLGGQVSPGRQARARQENAGGYSLGDPRSDLLCQWCRCRSVDMKLKYRRHASVVHYKSSLLVISFDLAAAQEQSPRGKDLTGLCKSTIPRWLRQP